MTSPSMRDVARAASVSVSTVSKALRNWHGLPNDTCVRIQELARTMGYRSDARVSTHMAYIQKDRGVKGLLPLALLHSFSIPGHLQAPGSREERLVLRSLQDRAEMLGYRLETFRIHDPEMPPERLRRILIARNCTGIVFWGPVLDAPPFDLTGFANVCLGRCFRSDTLHTVMSDGWAQAGTVFTEILTRGYRRPGVAIFSPDPGRAHPFEGRHSQAVTRGEISNIPCFLSAGFEREPFLAWFREHRPDGLWANHSGVLKWLTAAGFRIPEDLGVAYHVTPALDPWSSGLDRLVCEHAKNAVDLVVAQIHRNETGVPTIPHKLVIEGRWVEGHSMPPRPERLARTGARDHRKLCASLKKPKSSKAS